MRHRSFHGSEHLSGLSPYRDLAETEFNALPFGAIKLDINGRRPAYNAYEAKLARRDPGEVIGRNFFTEWLPAPMCRSSRDASGPGIDSGALNVTFPYRFLFPDRVVDVEITMMLGAVRHRRLVFVKKRGVTTTRQAI